VPWHTPFAVEFARLGSVGDHDNRLSGGVESGFLQSQLATKQSTATTEVRLLDGHKGTKQIGTIAVELGSRDSAEDFAATKQVSGAMDPRGGPLTLRKKSNGSHPDSLRHSDSI
jgi:hypothetical protein